MKKWFFLFLSVPVFFACKKSSDTSCSYTESTTVAPTSEIDSLTSYLSHQGILATQDASGVFYTIDSSGTGLIPGLCTNMTLTYKCFLLKNTAAVDSTDPGTTAVLQLGQLIAGWQQAMENVKAGSKVTIYIPPTLAYAGTIQRNGDGDIRIPAWSYLRFNVDLQSIQ